MIDFDKEKSNCASGYELLENLFSDFFYEYYEYFEEDLTNLKIYQIMSEMNWMPKTDKITKYGTYKYFNCSELEGLLMIYVSFKDMETILALKKILDNQILHPVQCCRILYLSIVKKQDILKLLEKEYLKRDEIEKSIKYYPDRFSFYFHSTSSEFLNSFFTLSILKREFVEDLEYRACITEDERGIFTIYFRIKDFASSLMNNYSDVQTHENYYELIKDYRAYQSFFEKAGKNIPDAMATYLHELSHMIFQDIRSYLEDMNYPEEVLKLPHWVYNYVQDFRINANIFKATNKTNYINFGNGLCIGTPVIPDNLDPDVQKYVEFVNEAFMSITEKDSQIASIQKIKSLSKNHNLTFCENKIIINNCPIYDDEQEIIGYKEIIIKDEHPGEKYENRSKERKKRIKAILTHVEKHTSKGNKGLPIYMESLIKNYIRGLVDPRDVLKNFISSSLSYSLESTIKRKNKKYTKFLPSVMKRYESNINVYVDESASVPDIILERFFGILKDLSEYCNLKIIPFDTEINEESIFQVEKGSDVFYNRTCGGGTQFDSALEHYQNEFQESLCDGAIIMTDGGSGRQIYPGLPLVWVLPETDTLGCKLGAHEEILKFPFSLGDSLTL